MRIITFRMKQVSNSTATTGSVTTGTGVWDGIVMNQGIGAGVMSLV